MEECSFVIGFDRFYVWINQLLAYYYCFKYIHLQHELIPCVQLPGLCRKCFVYKDEVWLAGDAYSVWKYDVHLQQRKQLKDQMYSHAMGVVRTPSRIVICDKKSGLHLPVTSGKYLCCLHPGHFSDLCLKGNDLFAVEYEQCQLYTFGLVCNRWEKRF